MSPHALEILAYVEGVSFEYVISSEPHVQLQQSSQPLTLPLRCRSPLRNARLVQALAHLLPPVIIIYEQCIPLHHKT